MPLSASSEVLSVIFFYHASQAAVEEGSCVVASSRQVIQITHCPTDTLWFKRWSLGCETRMGFILKQNKAISIHVVKALIKSFSDKALDPESTQSEKCKAINGLTFSTIAFCASLRGSEGLKLDLVSLKKHYSKGLTEGHKSPHVVIPLRGRFKGETGERCHLIPLASVTASNIKVRDSVGILIKLRQQQNHNNPWAFIDSNGSKMTFATMNEIILERLEDVKDNDHSNCLGLRDLDIQEEFSINRSFRRGSSTHAQNMKIKEPVINAQNRWRKTEAAKGRKQNFSMVENYADIEQLVPTLIQYSVML